MEKYTIIILTDGKDPNAIERLKQSLPNRHKNVSVVQHENAEQRLLDARVYASQVMAYNNERIVVFHAVQTCENTWMATPRPRSLTQWLTAVESELAVPIFECDGASLASALLVTLVKKGTLSNAPCRETEQADLAKKWGLDVRNNIMYGAPSDVDVSYYNGFPAALFVLTVDDNVIIEWRVRYAKYDDTYRLAHRCYNFLDKYPPTSHYPVRLWIDVEPQPKIAAKQEEVLLKPKEFSAVSADGTLFSGWNYALVYAGRSAAERKILWSVIASCFALMMIGIVIEIFFP